MVFSTTSYRDLHGIEEVDVIHVTLVFTDVKIQLVNQFILHLQYNVTANQKS